MLLFIFGLIGMARAACDTSVTSGYIENIAEQAEIAFVSLDPEGFSTALGALQEQSPCLTTPITPWAASRVHLTHALAAFLEQDEGRSIAALQAALAANPDLTLSERFGPGHPILTEIRVAQKLPTSPPVSLEPEEGAQILIDGHRHNAYIREQPALMQHVRGDTVLASVLLSPKDPLPAWAPLTPERLSLQVKRRMWLGGATVVATGTALTTLGTAIRGYQNFINENTNYARLDQYERQANRFSNIAIVSGSIAAGCGTALVLTW